MTSVRKLWGMPVLLGLSSALGLSAGLLGDGVWDGISALALAAPLLAGAWHVTKGLAARP